MALVDHHEPVPRGQRGHVVAPRQGLQHRHVHRAAHLHPAAAELARSHPEMLLQARPPLIGQRLAIDQNKRRGRMMGDHGARDHRLPRAGRCDQDPQLMIRESRERRSLVIAQPRGEPELLRLPERSVVGKLERDARPGRRT